MKQEIVWPCFDDFILDISYKGIHRHGGDHEYYTCFYNSFSFNKLLIKMTYEKSEYIIMSTYLQGECARASCLEEEDDWRRDSLSSKCGFIKGCENPNLVSHPLPTQVRLSSLVRMNYKSYILINYFLIDDLDLLIYTLGWVISDAIRANVILCQMVSWNRVVGYTVGHGPRRTCARVNYEPNERIQRKIFSKLDGL